MTRACINISYVWSRPPKRHDVVGQGEQIVIKRWILIGAGIAAALGVMVRVVTTPAVATPPQLSVNSTSRLPSGSNLWRVAWIVPVPGLTEVSLSADGTNIAWTDEKGCVRRLLADSGRTVWRTAPLSDVNHVQASPDGTVAAYSALNPDRNSVVFLHPKYGDLKSRVFAGNGAVWSTAFSGDGIAFVGTGGKTIYTLRAPSPEQTLISTDGLPESVAIAPDAARIALGTWAPAGILSCSFSGKSSCWRRADPESDRTCRVSLSEDGTRLMVLSTRSARETDGIIRVHDGKSGAVLWEVRLPAGSAQPSARLSANGDYVAVTYKRTDDVMHPDDWRLSYFNAEGQRLFADKGSALFKPVIAAVGADGSTVTVLHENNTLFTLDKYGNFLDKTPLPAGIQGRAVIVKGVASSRDGKRLLLQRRDGQLMMLRRDG